MKRSKPTTEQFDKNKNKKIEIPEKKGEKKADSKSPKPKKSEVPNDVIVADNTRRRNKERGRAQGYSCSLFECKSTSSRHNKNAPQHRTDLPVGKRKSVKHGGSVEV